LRRNRVLNHVKDGGEVRCQTLLFRSLSSIRATADPASSPS
jgi:hypothetical protein